MTIDVTKIKPGDTGTIKVTFESTATDVVKVSFTRAGFCKEISTHWLRVDLIATHAGWVPEPGDVVDILSKPTGLEWTILAVAKGFAWLDLDDDLPCTDRVDNLFLIRKGSKE